MPTIESIPAGRPCWADLFTSDPDRARGFYETLLGWTSESAGEEYGGYINFSKDGHLVAGGMRNDGEQGTPDSWTVYLAVADAEATCEAVRANGGQVIVPPMPVMELGTMGLVSDPGGAAIGIWQPGLHKGFGVLAEAGAPSWFELHTREYDASLKFYEAVFGWDLHVVSDEPDFRYATLGRDESSAAGIMDASRMLPDGMPSGWQLYFGVDDADATLAKVVELGGSVLMPAVDSPYGRLAVAADPTGASFRLVADG